MQKCRPPSTSITHIDPSLDGLEALAYIILKEATATRAGNYST